MKRKQEQGHEEPKKVHLEPEKSHTLYISNINDKINVLDVKQSLFLLCSTYGDVIDINTNWSNSRMRGQAHVIFSSIQESSRAFLNLQNHNFYGKTLKIDYSNKPSSLVVGAESDGSKSDDDH